ncbi:DUF3857 domain-containing transglutaminase family protein [Ruegeria sp. SCP11]|uniref:DUF3857 domain-containing transglutaminase family protein n=1 Tax=Ruegeria sp. SCP11 TaxID=3141378 RepID=UPI003335C114
MNAIFPDIPSAPVNAPIYSLETELTRDLRSERCRLQARQQFKLYLLLTLAACGFSVKFLTKTFGALAAIWYSDLALSTAGAELWAPLMPALLCLLFMWTYALSAGSYWAIWRGVAPVTLSHAERADSHVSYTINTDHITAQEPHHSESWHFAHVARPVRMGRFMIWKRPADRFYYTPLPSEDDAQHLLTKLKAECRPTGNSGFSVQGAPNSAIFQNISARSAFHALEEVSKKTGTACPAWTGSFFSYLIVLFLTGASVFLLWSITQARVESSGFVLFNQLVFVLGTMAMVALVAQIWSFLPKLHHLHYFRHGLMRGFDWGPTAVTCDKTGFEVWREGRLLRIDWPLVRAVHSENNLTIIETTADQMHVVPEIPSAANLLAASRTANGLGPWSDARRVTVPKEKKKKWWQSNAASIAFWVIIFLLLLGLLNVFGAKSAKAELLRNEHLPAWYEEISPQDRKAALTADRSVTLPIFDEKVRVEQDGYQTVRQSVFVVHDRSMLENLGEIRLQVDPNFESATLHRLRIHRDGRIVDQLMLPFNELNLEPKLDSGVMQGDVEYFGQIADLRVGDSVEMIWSKTAKTPVFPDQFHFTADKPKDWGWELRRTSIDLPTSTWFALEHTSDFAVTRREADGRTVLTWALNKIEEDDRNLRTAEDWDVSNDGLQLSTFQSWSQIAQQFAEDYRPRPDLLPDDLVAVLKDIAAQSEDPEWRATQALRLVQDRVRYFSVSIGEGGWIPRAPGTVWSSAYGDCKDKALLLISMLAQLNIQADVVIVDHDIGPALPRMLPSPFVFDHAIVRVRDDHGDWFTDPTDLLQGGIGRAIPLTDFAWGLPLSADSTELVEIVRQVSDEPTFEVLQEYTLLDEGPTAAILDVTETWRGIDADYRRWRHDGQDDEERRENYEEWYAKRFPGATHPEEMVVEDDLDANVLKLVQRYHLPRDGFDEKGLWDKLSHYAYAVSGELYEFDEDEELAGQSQVNDPMHAVHKVVMRNVPAPLEQPIGQSFENRFIKFSTYGDWNEAEAVLSYEWTLKTKKTTLKPGDEGAWREGADFVDDHDYYNVNLHFNLFEAVANKPLYMGLSATQLMLFPVLVLMTLLTLLIFRKGVRAEVVASKAKIDAGDG